MTDPRADEIRDLWAAGQRARAEYRRMTAEYERQDPSLCIEDGCDDVRLEETNQRGQHKVRERCQEHHAQAKRRNHKAWRVRNPAESTVRVRAYRARLKAKETEK